jgi:co-chaperonin GroES (HSP10)
MRALNKNILIRPIASEKETKSGLLVTESKNPTFKKGVVVLKAADASQPIEVGQTVLYYSRAIQLRDLPVDGEFYDLVADQGLLLDLQESKIIL